MIITLPILNRSNAFSNRKAFYSLPSTVILQSIAGTQASPAKSAFEITYIVSREALNSTHSRQNTISRLGQIKSNSRFDIFVSLHISTFPLLDLASAITALTHTWLISI